MSNKTTYNCDVCGAEIESGKIKHITIIDRDNPKKRDGSIVYYDGNEEYIPLLIYNDCCLECYDMIYEQITKFFNGMKPESESKNG